MRNLDTLLDRSIIASGGTVATIYFLAALALGWRVIFSQPARRTRQPNLSPLSAHDVHGIMWAAVVVFVALFIRYSMTVLGRLEKVDWGSFRFDVMALSCDLVMIAAATFAIYAASRTICGCKCAVLFFVVAGLPGTVIYLWS